MNKVLMMANTLLIIVMLVWLITLTKLTCSNTDNIHGVIKTIGAQIDYDAANNDLLLNTSHGKNP